jgi:hypothetical protein
VGPKIANWGRSRRESTRVEGDLQDGCARIDWEPMRRTDPRQGRGHVGLSRRVRASGPRIRPGRQANPSAGYGDPPCGSRQPPLPLPPSSAGSRSRLSETALSATRTLEPDIEMAPTSGRDFLARSVGRQSREARLERVSRVRRPALDPTARLTPAAGEVSEAVRWLPVDTSIDLSDERRGPRPQGFSELLSVYNEIAYILL